MADRAQASALPEPERANDAIIARCRREIERRGKRLARGALLTIVRHRFGLAELGEGFQYGGPLKIAPGSRIGRFAYLGPGFEANGPIVVGDLCMIASGCAIVGNDHLIDRAGTPTRLAFAESPRPPTIFGADVWVGQRATILEGVTIGRGAVVAAASMVLKDVPPHAIVAGVPARMIRQRFADPTDHARAVYADAFPGREA